MVAKPVKDIAMFRELHDKDVIVPRKIRAALEALLKDGPESWEYEGDLIKMSGISQTDMSKYREQFLDHIVAAPGTSNRAGRNVWFAAIKVAKKIRGEL